MTVTVRMRIESAVVRALAGLPPSLLRRIVGRPVVIDGQELHVEVQLGLKLLELSGSRQLDTLSVADARAQVATDARTFEGPKVSIDRVEGLTVDGAERPLGARLYVPRGSLRPGLLVYYHGGGFVVCDLETHDNTCRFLAAHAGAPVLSVDYRLAPEHPFPAAIDDAVAAYQWATEHAADFGVDPACVAVGGDSAGGNLAAGVAQRASPAFQLLFYPWLDLSRQRESYRLFSEGFYLTERELDWYAAHYLGSNEGAASDPRCSPLLAESVAGAAPAYIATAGFDPLRDEGEEYAERLRAAGVPVVLRRHSGLVHAFANALGIGSTGRSALLEAAGALSVGLAGARVRRSGSQP